VFVGHRADQLGSPDAVVVSSAIPPGNEEVEAARDRGIAVLHRAQVLAALMRRHRGIAVSGTHGKTTTTSMIAVVLEAAGLDPTYVVGGELNESGSNARSGRGAPFVAEADESDGSFLLLRPVVALVTNVEEEHHDFYRNLAETEAAFVAFCRGADTVIACGDDPGARRVAEASGRPVRFYGEAAESEVRLEILEATLKGGRASVSGLGSPFTLQLPLPGRHYLLNAVAAICAAAEFGVAPGDAARTLASFGGVRRRFESRGSAGGALFVDDYAHHPTELAATIQTARSNGVQRLVAIFQPHRYTRTAALWRELGESLSDADLIVVTEVYGAGELPMPGVSAKLVVDAVAEKTPGKRVVYLPHRRDLVPFLVGEVRVGDLVLTLGAGDIGMVGDEALARLRENDGLD
jgi:UDP-N-acetylmuramate--alanine ligase